MQNSCLYATQLIILVSTNNKLCRTTTLDDLNITLAQDYFTIILHNFINEGVVIVSNLLGVLS